MGYASGVTTPGAPPAPPPRARGPSRLARVGGRIAAGLALVWLVALVAWPEQRIHLRTVWALDDVAPTTITRASRTYRVVHARVTGTRFMRCGGFRQTCYEVVAKRDALLAPSP